MGFTYFWCAHKSTNQKFNYFPFFFGQIMFFEQETKVLGNEYGTLGLTSLDNMCNGTPRLSPS